MTSNEQDDFVCVTIKNVCSLRFFNTSVILDDVKLSLQLLADFPDLMAGYDLVGQEDPGRTLLYYLSALQYPASLHPPQDLPYFFHAGETSRSDCLISL